MTVREKFISRLLPQASGCVFHSSSCKTPARYGAAMWRGKLRPAHRVAWEIANRRRVPAGMMILHACDTPACVNPEHLRPGTATDNAGDRCVRGRSNSKPRLPDGAFRGRRLVILVSADEEARVLADAAKAGLDRSKYTRLRLGLEPGHA